MSKKDLEKYKFVARWKFAFLAAILIFAGFLQLVQAPMANEFIALLIGLLGGDVIKKQISL